MMSNVKEKDTKKENMVLTMILWGVMATVALTAMLYAASSKTIVITDTLVESPELSEKDLVTDVSGLLLQTDETYDRTICIPLAKGTKAENVVMENRYMERELWIYLQGADKDFYEQNAIYGDINPVLNGYCEEQQSSVVLRLEMDTVWEYRSTMENDVLAITCYRPGELYDNIVVADPVGGGSEYGVRVDSHSEKKIALQIGKELQQKNEPEHTKIYYTRMEDIEVSREDRLALIKAVDADLYLGIRACEDSEHSEYYGIHGFYNGEYFIPEYGNVQWADVLTRNVTIAASNRAIGLTQAEEGSILYDIDIPAAEVCVGYLSNPEELALLTLEEYQGKLAKGMMDAIEEYFRIQKTEIEVEE